MAVLDRMQRIIKIFYVIFKKLNEKDNLFIVIEKKLKCNYINIKISIHIAFFRLVFQNFSFFKIKTYFYVKQKMLDHPNRKK